MQIVGLALFFLFVGSTDVLGWLEGISLGIELGTKDGEREGWIDGISEVDG